ncbi:MAG: hypothetical protein WC367_01175 [Methanoregula sp.]|jgi:hypothetical protein
MQSIGNSKNRNERAVSEAIGFILIFGIIISGIALVTLYGYPMLIQQQTNADEQIMEKNMIVLQNDVKSLAYKTVPYKETSLKVGGGALVVYNSTVDPANAHFEISDTNGQIKNDDGTTPLTFYPGDLRYESTSAQTGMSLENGAVVKRMLAQEGSTMLAAPRWFVDDQTNTAVIYLIGFNSTDSMAQTGVGTVKMGLDQEKTNSTSYDIPSGDIIHIKYEPNANANYSTAWDSYFSTALGMNPDGSGGYTFPPGTVKLVVNRYEILIKSV